MWLEKLILIFKDKQLRNKILFILLIFALFRLMANVPVPGISSENLKRLFSSGGAGGAFGLLDLLVGGALSRLSIIMLGLGPYITAIIVMQLLTMIFPKLEKIYKEEGEEGRQRFNQYARILTVPLAILQSFGMLTLLQKQGAILALQRYQIFTSVVTITAGTLFLMWLGELITEKGIGNGVSLLIFAGIVAQMPVGLRTIFLTKGKTDLPTLFFFFGLSLLIIAGVVFVTEARRNIPISYAKRVRGHRIYGGVSTYLPMSVNPAGVIPIIFAISLLLFPSMVANFLATLNNPTIVSFAKSITLFFQKPVVYGIFLFLLVFFFTYFYTAVTFDPKTIAKNLQKMGGFVPGIRPGDKTAAFLHKILYRILIIGGLFLATIAILPSVLGGAAGFKLEAQAFRFLIGGTGVLIVVSVVLETWRQLKAQLEMKEYERI